MVNPCEGIWLLLISKTVIRPCSLDKHVARELQSSIVSNEAERSKTGRPSSESLDFSRCGIESSIEESSHADLTDRESASRCFASKMILF